MIIIIIVISIIIIIIIIIIKLQTFRNANTMQLFSKFHCSLQALAQAVGSLLALCGIPRLHQTVLRFRKSQSQNLQVPRRAGLPHPEIHRCVRRWN